MIGIKFFIILDVLFNFFIVNIGKGLVFMCNGVYFYIKIILDKMYKCICML